MKIYNEVVIDMTTGETVSEDSFEYEGPVALCISPSAQAQIDRALAGLTASQLSSSGGRTQPRRTIEEVDEEIAFLQSERERRKTSQTQEGMDPGALQLDIARLEGERQDIQQFFSPENQNFQLAQELRNRELLRLQETEPQRAQLEELELQSALELGPLKADLARAQVQQAATANEILTTQLQTLNEARDLGQITGDLSTEEEAFFDTLEENAISQLTNALNEQSEEVFGAAIADLTARGVLQGGIGERVMSRLGEKQLDLLERGTTDIESNLISQRLAQRERNRRFGLDIQRTVLSGALSGTQGASQIAGGAGIPGDVTATTRQTTQQAIANAIAGQQLEQSALEAQLGAGIQLTGIRSQEKMAQDRLNLAIAQMGQDSGGSGLGSLVGQAAGIAASIGTQGFTAPLALANFSSKRYKENIKFVRKAELKSGKSVDIVSFNYVWNRAKKVIGVIAEELYEVLPEAVVLSDGKPDRVNYGILNANLQV